MSLLNEYRPSWVFADGNEIAQEMRVRVRGRSNMTLLPDFFTVDLYNISKQDEAVLRSSKNLTVRVDDGSTICNGEIEEIYTHEEGANTLTTVSVGDGQSFWGSGVNQSFGAGAYMLDIVRSISAGCVRVGTFYCGDARLTRGQTVSGRVADAVSVIAKSLGARAYVTNGVLWLVEKGKGANTSTIREEDVIGLPETVGGVVIVQTKTRSYSVGDIVVYRGRRMRIITRGVSLDNLEGDWNVEIALVDESTFSSQEMEGGW